MSRVFAQPITEERILSNMQKLSTTLHNCIYDLKKLDDQLAGVTDGDLESALVDESGSGGQTAAEKRADIRNWQAAIQAMIANYEGTGTVADRSYEIGKRVLF